MLDAGCWMLDAGYGRKQLISVFSFNCGFEKVDFSAQFLQPSEISFLFLFVCK